MAYLGDLSAQFNQPQGVAQAKPQGAGTAPASGGGQYLGDLSSQVAAHAKKPAQPRPEATQAMTPREIARAKELSVTEPPSATADVLGRIGTNIGQAVEHPLETAKGIAEALPGVGGAVRGYQAARQGMTPKEIEHATHEFELDELRKGRSPSDAKILAKARFNEFYTGHPWRQAVEAGLQTEMGHDIGGLAAAGAGAIAAPLGPIGAGAAGAGAFQAAQEGLEGGFQKDPRQAIANVASTGILGAAGGGAESLLPGEETAKTAPATSGLGKLAVEGRGAEAPAPGQPSTAEAPAPRGGPGQPPVTPATPPENATLDRPAVRVKKTGQQIDGQPGENHNQILRRAGLRDKQVERGFRNDEGHFVTREQARQQILTQRGVDVGKGSPTSEQLEAEQGLRPPGEGVPGTPGKRIGAGMKFPGQEPMKPEPAITPQRIAEIQASPHGMLTKAEIEAAYGQKMPLINKGKAAPAVPITDAEHISMHETKAHEAQAKGDLGGAMKHVDAANSARMRLASSKAVRDARAAAAGPTLRSSELYAAAADAKQRGDMMGAQNLQNQAHLAMAREKGLIKTPAVSPIGAPEAQPAIPQAAPAAAPAAEVVKPPPVVATAPELTAQSVPAKIPAKGLEAIRDEKTNKVYTPANGKTYEALKAQAAKQPLKYSVGKLAADGKFRASKTQGKIPATPVVGPPEPVEPAPTPHVAEIAKEPLAIKVRGILEDKPKGALVLPEAVTHAADEIISAKEKIQNLGKALAVNFGGSFEEVAMHGKGIMRATRGGANQLIAQMSHMFDSARPALESLSKDDRLDWMERADKGQPQATPQLQEISDAWHGLNGRMLDQATRLAKRLGVDPSKIMPAFKEFYFPRVFKNAKEGEAAFSMWQQNRRMGGTQEFFKQREYPTLADAIEANKTAGRELISDNPVDILEHTYKEFQKYMSALDAMGQMEGAGLRKWVKPDEGAPQGWVPEPTEFSRLKVGKMAGEKAAGQYYVPEPLGHAINNHLSPGLWRQGWYRTLRYGNNAMNGLQLGFSGFHVMMTGVSSMASDLALGMQKLASGDISGIANAARAALFPSSSIGFWREGYNAEKAFYNGDMGGELHPMMQAFFDAGGRLHVDKEYINGHVAAFKDAVRQGKGLGIRNLLRLPFTAAEYASKPLFETLIPRIKLGVFMEQAAHELKDLDPQLDRAEYLKKAQGVLDSIDNRFGMINYDNLFWNKTYQNMIHIFTRAPGWYLGTFREYGGAFKDLLRPDKLIRGETSGRRLAFALSSLVSTALLSTMYQYAATGTTPHIDPKDPWTSWRNLMHPLSGRTLADGTPERIQWPSYIKDLEEMQYAVTNQAGSVKGYFASKMSPLVALASSLGSNADWKNQMIRNPADPYLKQWYDTLKYIGKDNLLPISVQNIARRNDLQSAGLAANAQNKQPLIEAALGITVPKRRWLETPFRNALYEDRLRTLPRGPKTPEEAKATQLRNEWASLARRVKDPAQLQQYAEQYYQKGLSINQLKAGLKMSQEDPLEQALKGSSLRSLLANYDKASPDEQREAILAIGSKMKKAGSTLGAKEYGADAAKFQHILIEYEKLHRSDPEAVAKAEKGED